MGMTDCRNHATYINSLLKTCKVDGVDDPNADGFKCKWFKKKQIAVLQEVAGSLSVCQGYAAGFNSIVTEYALLPFRPFLCNGGKIDFVYLIATMPGTCIGGDTSSQVKKLLQCRATFF